MSKRAYRKYTDIYAEFERFCRERARENIFLIPPERTLTEILAGSRMTIRKVLAEAEANGLIRREGHQTHILPDKRLNGCGRIVFLAQGQGQGVYPPAIERLWLTLKPQLESAGADFRLVQANRLTSFEKLRREVDAADVILLTIIDQPELLEYLRKCREDKHIVALYDPYLEMFDHVIALDNYRVGTMAAEVLHRAGCRKIAVCGGFDHPIFNKRRQGVADGAQPLGARFVSYPFSQGGTAERISFCANALVHAYEHGCDGMFIVSDEWMDEITAPVYALGVVPGKFKILSFNGSGDYMLCHPRVSVLNQGTAEIVENIMAHLENPGPVRILVSPQLYKNQTTGLL